MAKKGWGRVVLLFIGSFALGWLVSELRPRDTKTKPSKELPSSTIRESSEPPGQNRPPEAQRHEREDLRRKIRAAKRRSAELERQIEEFKEKSRPPSTFNELSEDLRQPLLEAWNHARRLKLTEPLTKTSMAEAQRYAFEQRSLKKLASRLLPTLFQSLAEAETNTAELSWLLRVLASRPFSSRESRHEVFTAFITALETYTFTKKDRARFLLLCPLNSDPKNCARFLTLLVDASRDADQSLRRAALTQLGRIRDPGGRTHVLAVLNDESQPLADRVWALQSLPPFADSFETDVLAFTQCKEAPLRLAALQRLRRSLLSRSSLETLASSYSWLSHEDRLQVNRILGSYHPKYAEAQIMSVLKDKTQTEDVRKDGHALLKIWERRKAGRLSKDERPR